MKNYFYLISVPLCLLCCQISFAQADKPSSPASTGTSGTGANYDMLTQKMLFRLSPDSSLYIKGKVQINFRTNQASVSTVTFDLNSAFTVDSVVYHGVKLLINVTPVGDILSVNLGTTLANNKFDSIYIYYKGVPPLPPAGSGPQGLKKQTFNGYTYMMSVAESYQDRDWFPCKADMQDKIDTLEVKISVPWASPSAADTFWAISNGRLIDSAIVGSNRIFTYRSVYPTASYLVCVAAGRYNHYYRTVNINGTNVPVVYHLLIGRTAGSYPTIVTALDKINLVLDAFSQKFGDYPFKNEKHGFYDGLVGAGGIEHQTTASISTGSISNVQTLAHELAHQWFGDNVTTATWNDLWLAEGFANYSEILAAEFVPALSLNPYTIRSAVRTAALGYTSHSAWIPNSNSTTSALIWGSTYSNTVYKRGAMIVSMLRAMSGDTKFFQALTNYQTARAGKSANADTLKRYFNQVLGQDITPFFNDYVGGSGPAAAAVGGVGNPIINVNWANPSGNILDVSIASQTQSGGSNVTYFNGPVVVHVKGTLPSQDTTIVFFDWGAATGLSKAGNGISAPIAGGYLRYFLSFKPITVAYDDSARTLSTGSTAKVAVLAIKVIDFNAHKVINGNEINLKLFKDEPIARIALLKSTDGINFTEIGDMMAAGNNGQEFNYVFTDHNNSAERIFYKAKIISMVNEEFTKIVKIQSSQASEITITPNPADKLLNISFSNNSKEKAVINVISAEGKVVMQSSTNNNYLKLNISNLPVGVYAIQLMVNNEMLQTKKLLIQR